jgi:hypothetical protein
MSLQADNRSCCSAVNVAFGSGVNEMAVVANQGRIEMEANYSGEELAARIAAISPYVALNDQLRMALFRLFEYKCNPCCQGAALGIRELFIGAIRSAFSVAASVAVLTADLVQHLSSASAALERNVNAIIGTLSQEPFPPDTAARHKEQSESCYHNHKKSSEKKDKRH